MALYNYKLGLKEKHLVFRDREVGRLLGFKRDKNKTPGKEKNNLMFEGVDLGEVMKQTVMEELRLIKLENGENMHRIEGS